jgi:predicted ribosome quality control (RQC) complex YloA/Tae2 family protein
VGQAVSDVAYRFEKLGYEAGKDALPLFGTAAGAVLGGAGGIIAGGTQYAAHFANKGMDMVDDTRKDSKDFAVKTIEMGAEGFDKTREGMKEYALETQRGLKEHVEHHADNAEKLAEKVLDNTKEVINKGIGIFDVTGAAKSIATNLADKISEAQIKKAEADARAREKEISEKENQIKKLEERIAKKDEKIEKLEEKIEKLEEKLEKSQDRLIVQVEEVAKSRSSSPTPYSRQ